MLLILFSFSSLFALTFRSNLTLSSEFWYIKLLSVSSSRSKSWLLSSLLSSIPIALYTDYWLEQVWASTFSINLCDILARHIGAKNQQAFPKLSGKRVWFNGIIGACREIICVSRRVWKLRARCLTRSVIIVRPVVFVKMLELKLDISESDLL